MERERAWLARCAPIFMQPEVDVRKGNGLVKLFFEFQHDGQGRLCCDLVVVLESEESYPRFNLEARNPIATTFYRSFNKLKFGRTADLNYLTFRGVDLQPESPLPWASIYSFDHSGDQSLMHGNKGSCGPWFSLFYHYKKDVSYGEWQRKGDRPLVYLNTQNHMMGEVNRNPDLPLKAWETYLLGVGSQATAEAYARHHVTTKPLLWAPLTRCLTPKNLVLDERGEPCKRPCCAGQPPDGFRTVWQTELVMDVPFGAKSPGGVARDGILDNERGNGMRGEGLGWLRERR
ncbi:hypothetical protein KFL_009160040 [Klebsormidium nitens]|uniref:Uncharacterized protein n=1 Tax=Klebsormidium nitens TaxID=105231 RepID=A0A1Y1IUZ3_KLENI|nr:hypothetical protein KFL_009160040 [Klebsormidium nitens]|eukprot:GAQ92068.1 hypothetical protein KFL_009160040 [Klebsormidium nitens]